MLYALSLRVSSHSDAIAALWAYLRTLLQLAIGAGIVAGVFALAVAFWLPLLQLTGGAAIIALFAAATYPRKAVR